MNLIHLLVVIIYILNIIAKLIWIVIFKVFELTKYILYTVADIINKFSDRRHCRV